MSVLTNAFAFCKNNSRKARKSVNKKKKKSVATSEDEQGVKKI